MGIWSSGYMHMYACERQIEAREGEKRKCNSRLHVLVLQRGWACVGGGEGKKREQRLRNECGDDGDSARQRVCEPMSLTIRGIIMWKQQ